MFCLQIANFERKKSLRRRRGKNEEEILEENEANRNRDMSPAARSTYAFQITTLVYPCQYTHILFTIKVAS